jgi:hypothetical protein
MMFLSIAYTIRNRWWKSLVNSGCLGKSKISNYSVKKNVWKVKQANQIL